MVDPGGRPIELNRRERPARPRVVGHPGPLRQWSVLTVRNTEVMARNRLTSAILLGSPALVIAMLVVLLPAGWFDDPSAAGSGPPQTLFWIAFATFFFGLTYGLLQIVTERPVLHRERFAGLGVGPYVASKVTVLLPLLTAVSIVLLAVLRALDRLPAGDWPTYGRLLTTSVLASAAGLLIGLAASALVRDPAQATLALPMICFPQVLFGGAVVPVDQMTGVGAGMSVAMTTRWAFESFGRTLGLGSPASPYRQAFSGSPVAGWVALGLLTAVGAILASVAVARR